MSDAPLCTDCQCYFPDWRGETDIRSHPAQCRRIVRHESNLVTGKTGVLGTFDPYSERHSDRTLFGRAKCGPAGRYFQLRVPPTPPTTGSAR